jgi:RNA polymerase sigma-70 factor, ECF subfamily
MPSGGRKWNGASFMVSVAPEREVAEPGDHAAGASRRTAGPTLMPRSVPPAERDRVVRSLYEEHGRVLLAYATRLMSDSHHAEDVVQETMLRAWRNAERLTPERGSVISWLMRVAHNVAIDKIRARRARPDEVDEKAAPAVSQHDHAGDVVESIFVAAALQKLTPAHRTVLREVYFADRTAAEAAKTLGLPVGTVKSRVHHALRQLRLHLDEQRAEMGVR